MGFSIISHASTLGSLYLHSIWMGVSPSLPTWNAVRSEDGVVDDDDETVDVTADRERMGGSSVRGELAAMSTSIEQASGVKQGAATDKDGSLVLLVMKVEEEEEKSLDEGVYCQRGLSCSCSSGDGYEDSRVSVALAAAVATGGTSREL